MGIPSSILSSVSAEMWPYHSLSYASSGSMHLPTAALHRLTHAVSVNKSKGRGRNISASRLSHFPPQPTSNRLILFHSFVFMLLDLLNVFPHTFCNMHNSIFVLTVYIYNQLIRFHFPSETHQQVKIQFKNNNWGKQRHPCSSAGRVI